MLKHTKIYQRAWLRYQKILALIEEKLGLHDQFEDILDHWKRKGLVREIDASKLVPVHAFHRENAVFQRREMWDDIVKATLREPRDLRPEAVSRTEPGRPPDRRRMRRLYRWQLRNQPKGLREMYDYLVADLKPEAG